MIILLIVIIFVLAAVFFGFLGLAVWRNEDKKKGEKSFWKSFWDFYSYFNQAHPLMAQVFNFVIFIPVALIITLIIALFAGGF